MKRAIRITWTLLPILTASLAFAQTSAVVAAAPAPTAVEPAASATPTAPAPSAESAPSTTTNETDITQCKAQIAKTVRTEHRARLEAACKRMEKIPSCVSEEGHVIGHINFDSQSNDVRAQKRVLVFGLIHGDEPLAGEMAIEWAERLFKLRGEKIEARNSWRVVPMLNPDGLERKTRMNAHGVDLNRNFPTRDWDENASTYWKKSGKSDPRRFPGDKANSEAETRCAIAQIKDFKPDFIVSVHTPYHVLDFDGPHMPFPKYKDLPWRALGNFPGSLGRYMWADYQVPVLTVELGTSMIDAANLQDIVGTFAIDASRRSGAKTASLFDRL